MNALLPFVVAGLVSGSVYGLAGAGLVLTYKTSGVFNFAQGALATVAAYLFYSLHVQHGLSWPLSAAVCVVGLGVVLGLSFEPFARRISRAPIAQQIAGTVGIMIVVEAAATLIYGPDPILVPPFLPTDSFSIGGVSVTAGQMIIIAIGLALTGGLYVFLQRYRLGIAMRAVVDDPDLVSLSQFSPYAIRRSAWIIGCTLATLSGVLLVPSISLDPTLLTLLVVQAFGAAAIGRFTSLPLTYAGGLLLGVVFDGFVERLRQRADALRVGDPLDLSTDMGPLTFRGQYDKVRSFLEAEHIVFGGRTASQLFPAASGLRDGFYVEPTLLSASAHRAVREEIFGPVAVAIPFEDEHEAIEIANDTRYGLAAGVWTESVRRAHRMTRALAAGTVWVNTYRRLHWQMPFGGHKESGNGPAYGFEALREWTNLKAVWIETGP